LRYSSLLPLLFFYSVILLLSFFIPTAFLLANAEETQVQLKWSMGQDRKLPTERWKREQEMKSREQRKPNPLLREQRLLRGWSLQRVVEELCTLSSADDRLPGVNAPMVSNWETGTKKPSPFYRERLCKLYKMTADQLGFMDMPVAPRVSEFNRVQPNSTLVYAFQETPSNKPMNSDRSRSVEIGNKGLSSIKKQNQEPYTTLINGMDQVTRYFLEDKQKQEGEQFSRRQILSLLIGVSAAAFSLDRTSDISLLQEEEILSLCTVNVSFAWQLYFAGGIHEVSQILPDYLSSLVGIVKSASKSQQLAARLAAQVYQLDWLLALQRLDFGKALSSIKQSFQYGEIAEDSNLRASALVRQAHIFFHLKRPVQQMQLHQKAMQYSNHLSPLLQGWLYIVLAESHASLGEEYEANHFMGLAYEVFPDQPEHDPNFSYVPVSHFTLANHQALTYLHLNKPEKSWDTLTKIDKIVPTLVMPNRVELLSRQTSTALMLGDMERTCSYFESAAIAARKLGSYLRQSEISETYEQMLKAWPHEKKVKALAELLQEA
jgi:transcriptional regulator with XRE-family HTH domain/tetratricopeptide (TPR) repeat protein